MINTGFTHTHRVKYEIHGLVDISRYGTQSEKNLLSHTDDKEMTKDVSTAPQKCMSSILQPHDSVI